MSRSSSRAYRGEARRAVSRSVGTSTRATASWASSSRRLPPSRVAVRSAARMALLVGPDVRTGHVRPRTAAGATDCRQVNATVISSRRQSRSWNAASVAALAASSADVHAVGGHAQFGERVLHVRAAEHVHADPARGRGPGPGWPAAAPRTARCRPAARRWRARAACPPRRAYSYGTWLANRQTSMPGAEPEHLVRGLLLAAVGGGDQPPGSGADEPVGQDGAVARLAAGLARRAGQPARLAGVPDSMIRSTRSCGPTMPIVSSPGVRWRWPVIGLFPPQPLTVGSHVTVAADVRASMSAIRLVPTAALRTVRPLR